MAGRDKGKAFEERVKADWELTVPDSLICRIPDQMTGYTGSTNVSDFFAFKSPRLFFIECKVTQTNTVPFSRLTQYEKMLPYCNTTNVFPGFVVWWEKSDTVAWVPVNTVTALKEAGEKSINIKNMQDDRYYIVPIPSEKKRVFMRCDFKVLLEVHK